MVSTEEYAPGRSIDIHGDGTKGLVLMWHGRGPNERGALSTLAKAVAAHGIRVLVADWNSQADDGGRADLLTSMRYAREHAVAIGLDPARLVVVGWSLGGTAAVSLAVHAKRLGLPPLRVVLIAPGDGPRAVDPVSGARLPETFPPGDDVIDILHGTADDISYAELVLGLDARLRASGWRTRVTELDADHMTIVERPEAAATIVEAVGATS